MHACLRPLAASALASHATDFDCLPTTIVRPALPLGTKSVKRARALILARWWRCRQTSGRRSARAADGKASESPPRAAGCWATLSKQRRQRGRGAVTAAAAAPQPSSRLSESCPTKSSLRHGRATPPLRLYYGRAPWPLTCMRGASRRVRSGWNRGTGASMQGWVTGCEHGWWLGRGRYSLGPRKGGGGRGMQGCGCDPVVSTARAQRR